MRKTLNINSDTYERIRAIALNKKTTMTILINQALEGYINGYDFSKRLEPEIMQFIENTLKAKLKKNEKKNT